MMKPLGLALVLIVVASSAFAADSDITPVVGKSYSNRKMKTIPVELFLVGYTEANCIEKGQPCGLLLVCCEGLSCTGVITGTCIRVVLSASPWEELGSSAYALEQA